MTTESFGTSNSLQGLDALDKVRAQKNEITRITCSKGYDFLRKHSISLVGCTTGTLTACQKCKAGRSCAMMKSGIQKTHDDRVRGGLHFPPIELAHSSVRPLRK